MENLPSNLSVFNSPSSLCNLKENRIIFETHFSFEKWFTHLPSSEDGLRTTLFVHSQDITKSLYIECLRRYNRIFQFYKEKENTLLNIDNIVLKFIGKEDYLIDMNAPLLSYVHIQNCISKNIRIKIEFLQIDKIESILQFYSSPSFPLSPSLPPSLTSILQNYQLAKKII